jgi:purine-binding chemotaxis protein CheW
MDTSEKYALFKVKDTDYGIPVSQVREIINFDSKISVIPNSPQNVLGVIDLRGTTISVYDTRGIMGHDSLLKEREALVNILKQREQDHKNWLEELKNCCIEQREFKLQRNPHLCAFGKWYDVYVEDTTVGYEVRHHLKKFDKPHKEIHALADEIDIFIHRGCYEDAIGLVEHAESTILSAMLTLFADFYTMIHKQRERDIALVVDYGSKVGAFPVDKINSIDYLSEILPLNVFSSSKLVSNYGKKDDKTILILNLEAIFD